MASDIFLKIDSVEGESTDDAHKGWIEVMSMSHGVVQTGTGGVSGVGARTAGKCDHQDIHVSKYTDKSSPYMFKHCCSGKHFPKVTVEICKSTGDPNKRPVYLKYELEHVIVTSLQVSHSNGGGTHPLESLSLQYGKIKWIYTPMDPKTGTPGGAVPAEWDVINNKGG